MSLVEESKGTAPSIPDGVYTFQITDVIDGIRQSDTFGKAGEPTVTLRCLIMGILNEEGEDVYLDPLLARKFSRGGKYQPSNLYLFAKGAGVVPPEGHPFDTDLLKDKVLTGMIVTEEGKWPKFVLESIKPAAKPPAQKAQGAPSEARVPWESAETGVDDLATWRTKLIDVGYTPAEIANHSKAAYDRLPADLTPIEREELAKSLGV